MTSHEFHALIRDDMTRAGFVKQGRRWLMRTGEILWLVQLDRSPYKDRFSLDIGAVLADAPTDSVPAKPSDGQILMHLENLPLVAPREIPDARFTDFRSAVLIGFDLTYDIEDQERTKLIAAIIDAFSGYIGKINSRQELRMRYQAGDLESAFIRKDMRQLLAL
jgi:hypothetical protein